jgi:hypothetical protein
LIGVMDRTIVASQACLIGRAFLITRLSNVARVAFLPEQCVRMCKRPGIVRFRTSCKSVPTEPHESRHHERARKNPPPARNSVQRLEVIQIDALREFLSGSYASGHLISQGDQSMNRT